MTATPVGADWRGRLDHWSARGPGAASDVGADVRAALERLAVLEDLRSAADVSLTTWGRGIFLAYGPVAAVATWSLDVFVPGEPATKGSTRSFAVKANNARGMRAVTVPDNKQEAKSWASAVHGAVSDAWASAGPTTNAVVVAVDFVLPRRKSAPKTYTPWMTRKPDPDKLVRLVRDALTGVVYGDDAQVVAGTDTKREAEPGEAPGVRIRVAVLDERTRS